MNIQDKIYNYRRLKSIERCNGAQDCIDTIERMFSKTWKLKPITKATHLESLIIEFLRFEGHIAIKVSTGGTYIQPKIEKNIFGKPTIVKDGHYIKGGSTKGVSDLIVTIKGRVWFVEVKLGRDTQRNTQRNFEEEVATKGGIYSIVHDLDDFYKQYLAILTYFKVNAISNIL